MDTELDLNMAHRNLLLRANRYTQFLDRRLWTGVDNLLGGKVNNGDPDLQEQLGTSV